LKKKILNSILLALCVVIYASIFFKFFGEKEVIENHNSNLSYIAQKPFKKENKKTTFQLNIPSRDPFLNKIYASNKTKKKSPVKKSRINDIEPVFNWPTIKYYGFLKNKENKTRMVVLKVRNKMYRLREKSTIGDIKIENAYGDSIILKHKKELKTYLRL